MKKTSILFLAAAGLFFTYSCEKKPQEQGTQQDTSATEQKQTGLNDAAKDFMKESATDNMMEIQLGQLAQKQATSKEVKQFAQMLVQQHEQSGSQLKQLATQKNVMLPDSLEQNKKDELTKLAEKKGKEFDQEFISKMVDEHRKEIDDFKKRAENTEDPELKSWIQTTLPHLEHHYQEAKRLDSIMDIQNKKKSSLKK